MKFIFSGSEHCSDATETVYAEEHYRQLNEPARWTIAGALGVGALISLLYGIAQAMGPQQSYWTPTVGSRERDLAVSVGLFLVAVVPPFAILGGGYAALGQVHSPLPPSQNVVVVRTPESVSHPRLEKGVVTGPGLPAAGRELVAGVLELTLDEAVGLASGEVEVDGKRVDWVGDGAQRLSFLPACKDALAPLEPGSAQSLIDRRWQRANACDSHGWGFADAVLAELRSQFPVF